ncbi:MAG: efflux RND transporter periplasmic adaptor subunit [Isosphaeraceae bacterium]
MKRILIIVCAVTAAAVLIGGALVVARPDWVPALAGLGGSTEAHAEDAGLYCKEHGVPEKFCTICHEELTKSLLFCTEHGNIPEDICTLCHPEAAKKYNIEMCPNGHGLPKEFCQKCDKTTSVSPAWPDDGWCTTHGKPEVFCLECTHDPASLAGTGDTPAKECRQPLPTVTLASAKLADRVGILTASVVEETHAHTLNANAETAYNANAYADVSPRVGGYLREVRADLGKPVHQGEVLAVIDSAQISAAKAQYITVQSTVKLAQVTYDRTEALARSKAVAAMTELESLTALNQAKAGALNAEQTLRNFGFSDADLVRIIKDHDTTPLLEVKAPIDGIVVARHAVKGEAVQAATLLFAVADTSRVWLWIDVYETDVTSVHAGQGVSFVISGTEAPVFEGSLNWVGTEVNPLTRTTRVRAELANPFGRLRANQFGKAEIQIGVEHKAIVVPKAAVQRNDNVSVVFLPQEDGVYRPQRIVTKATNRRDVVEVSWGLKPGQRVVTNGSFLLKTEIMKGAIGAGCCK